MTIPNKESFLALAATGALGNQLRSWPTLEALFAAAYSGAVVIRARDKQSPWMVPWSSTECPCGCDTANDCCNESDYNTIVEHDFAEVLRNSQLEPSDFYFQEVPDRSTKRIANIEAMEDEQGMYLHLEPNTNEAVRGIRERTEALYGPTARLTLRNTISAESYETLEAIWDNYPTAIIEATEFPMAVGTLSKRLVIWEVRDF